MAQMHPVHAATPARSPRTSISVVRSDVRFRVCAALFSLGAAACGAADSDPQTSDDSGTTVPPAGDAGSSFDAPIVDDTPAVPPRDAPSTSSDAGTRLDVTNGTSDARVNGDRAPDTTTVVDSGAKDGTSSQDAVVRPDAGSTLDAARPDAGPTDDGGRPGWTLIFSDEFNAASGTGADTTKWTLVNKGDGFGNNELEFYTNRTDNAYHDGNGSLVIKVIKEDYMGRQYTSARLEGNGKFEHTFGRYEARLWLPKGQGIWPAFWMLGNDIGQVSWPNCGEIDIMENIGKEPSIVHGSLHGPGYSGGNPLGQSYTLPNGQKFADGFHVFAVEWEQNVIRFYMDDILYGTKTPTDTPSGAKWVYDHPFYILLNVAVGGAWPGSPDSTTTFPQTMLVDYVRVYSR